jgi:alpha-L-fucosidase
MERLEAMGKWMAVNGQSIYGTSASQFENLEWGRSTTKDHTLYLHIFNWPQDRKLPVPGLVSRAQKIYPLADPQMELSCDYQAGKAVISLPEKELTPYVSVLALEFPDEPEVIRSPVFSAESDIFHKNLSVTLSGSTKNTEIRYSLDGSQPSMNSSVYQDAIRLAKTATVKAQVFRNGDAVSAVVEKTYRKINPRPAEEKTGSAPGLHYAFFQGNWEHLPDFALLSPETEGTAENFDLSPAPRKEYFGILFRGYISVPEDGLYHFSVVSDDGSRLYIGDELVVDNDGLHGPAEITGQIILEKGTHPIRVDFFQGSGGIDLAVSYQGPGIEKQLIPAAILTH